MRLRQDDSFPDETPLTVHDMVMGTATKFAHYIALGSKRRHGWHLLTYIELYEECRRAAKAFLQVPTPPGPVRVETPRLPEFLRSNSRLPTPRCACASYPAACTQIHT